MEFWGAVSCFFGISALVALIPIATGPHPAATRAEQFRAGMAWGMFAVCMTAGVAALHAAGG